MTNCPGNDITPLNRKTRGACPGRLRGSGDFDPLPDVGNATVGSTRMRSGGFPRGPPVFLCSGGPANRPPPWVFFRISLERKWRENRRPGAFRERTEGERPVSGPTGSAATRTGSDGKPCSGVRGGQGASTDIPRTGGKRPLPVTLPCKGKALPYLPFSPCKSHF